MGARPQIAANGHNDGPDGLTDWLTRHSDVEDYQELPPDCESQLKQPKGRKLQAALSDAAPNPEAVCSAVDDIHSANQRMELVEDLALSKQYRLFLAGVRADRPGIAKLSDNALGDLTSVWELSSSPNQAVLDDLDLPVDETDFRKPDNRLSTAVLILLATKQLTEEWLELLGVTYDELSDFAKALIDKSDRLDGETIKRIGGDATKEHTEREGPDCTLDPQDVLPYDFERPSQQLGEHGSVVEKADSKRRSAIKSLVCDVRSAFDIDNAPDPETIPFELVGFSHNHLAFRHRTKNQKPGSFSLKRVGLRGAITVEPDRDGMSKQSFTLSNSEVKWSFYYRAEEVFGGNYEEFMESDYVAEVLGQIAGLEQHFMAQLVARL